MRSSAIARVVALSFLMTLGCGRSLVPLTPSSTVLLPQAQEADAVRAAIARAISARSMVAESEQPGHIIARFQQRAMILRLQINYTPTQYEVTYLDSQGFNQQVNPQGQTVISAQYPAQVRALTQTIDAEIARPARELAQAEQQAEQQRLALAQQETARQQAVLDAQAADRQADRNAQVETERLRAEAAANSRPIIVSPGQGAPVSQLAFDANAAGGGRDVLRVRPNMFGRSHQGMAGGNMAAASLNLPNYCVGFYSQEPSHVLRLDNDQEITVTATSRLDTTLAIVTSDGSVWCDDDSGGNNNPSIGGTFPAGVYYVWVGAFNQGEQARYAFSVNAYQGAPVVEQQAPVVQAPVRDPGCVQAMMQRSYAASDFHYCDNVESSCALAMIQRSYAGSDVQYCQGVEPQCAQAMIQRSYAGADVRFCQGVEPTCATAAIERGYSGADVANCRQ